MDLGCVCVLYVKQIAMFSVIKNHLFLVVVIRDLFTKFREVVGGRRREGNVRECLGDVIYIDFYFCVVEFLLTVR